VRKPPSRRSKRQMLYGPFRILSPPHTQEEGDRGGPQRQPSAALFLIIALTGEQADRPRLIAGAVLRLPKEATLHHVPCIRAVRPDLFVAGAALQLPW
jgi:hypothetical protein